MAKADTRHFADDIIFDFASDACGIDTDQPLHNKVAAYQCMVSAVMDADIVGTCGTNNIFENQIKQTAAHISGTAELKKITADKTGGHNGIFHRRVFSSLINSHAAAAVFKETTVNGVV